MKPQTGIKAACILQMIWRRPLTGAFVFFVSMNCWVRAATYHVATNGDDSGINDGFSWAQPFLTISNGLAKATAPGDVVIVSNGTYFTWFGQLQLTNPVTLVGTNGATATIVDAGNSNRCLWISNAQAVARGFTFQRGRIPGGAVAGGIRLDAGTVEACMIVSNSAGAVNSAGGGVQIAGSAGNVAILTNCVIAFNTCGGGGAGVYSAVNTAARIVDCTIISNTVTANQGGGGFYINNSAGTLENCIIIGNKTTGDFNYGAGYGVGATLRNCLVVNNSAPGYGGVFMSGGLVENCIFAGNYSDTTNTACGLHQNGTTVIRNTVVYDNKGMGPDYKSDGANSVTYSLTIPQVSGAGNTNANPLFINLAAGDYRFRPDSPCIDRGTNQAWMSAGRDLAGNARISPAATGRVDMGCYELGKDALSAVPAADVVNGTAPMSVIFTALTVGTNQSGLYYQWGFTNSGVVNAQGADKQVVTNVYGVGTWSVTLTVTNDGGEVASTTLTNYIKVGPAAVYVARDIGNSDTYPYDTWATAASNVQSAVNAGAFGTTVWVTNGFYTQAQSVVVREGIALKSVNGPDSVTIDGSNAAAACLYVNHTNAVVDGLVVRRGNRMGGSGIRLVAGTARNCIFTNNYGCAVNLLARGIMRDCLVIANTPAGNNDTSGITSQSDVKGSGQVDGGLVENCIVRNGGSCHYGGVCMTRATLRNCLITGNVGTSEGGNVTYKGGLYSLGCIVENCTIVSNSIIRPDTLAGVYADANTRFYNTIIWGNRNSVGLAPTNYSFSGSPAVYNSLLEPAYPSGIDCISGDPLFQTSGSNYTLSSGSPCVNRGTNLAWMTTTLTNDLAGNPRIQGGTNDMGACEFNSDLLACSFTASVARGFAPLAVILTSTLSGLDTNNAYYRWSFTNSAVVDREGYGFPMVTNAYPAGTYTPTLVVSNGSGTASFTLGTAIKAGPVTVYVARSGFNTAEFPYTNWATAASNIQAGINAGVQGTLVLVTNGTYPVSSQVLNSEGAIVRSVNGSALTTIDGSASARCYYSGHTSSVLQGFTLTKVAGGASGAGAYLQSGALVNCMVFSNTTGIGQSGAGIYLYGADTVVSNCVIVGNHAPFDFGGGLAQGGYAGGFVVNCVVSSNTSGSTGGAYLPLGCRLRNCLFANNTSGFWPARIGAGGLYIAGDGSVLENCTIVTNRTTHDTYAGGLQAETNVDLYNTIVYGNYSTNACPNYYGGRTAYHCDLSPAWAGPGSGNISADPVFYNPASNDFTLREGSPCIGAGTNLAWMPGSFDLNGQRRMSAGPVDMGAYEWQAPAGSLFTIQ